MAQWSQQNHIICEKQKRDPETTEPDTLHPPAAPRNSVHEQNRPTPTEASLTYCWKCKPTLTAVEQRLELAKNKHKIQAVTL